MFFRFCLWLLAKRIVSLMQDNERFKNVAGKKTCVIQFKTLDNKVARYFFFNMGKVETEATLHKKPSLTIAVPTSGEAFKLIIMLAKHPNDKAKPIEAIKQGQLRFIGDISLLTWFMSISDYFAPEEITIPVINKTIKV